MKKVLLSVFVLVLALGVVSLVSAQDISGELEIFSWWAGGARQQV